MWLERVSGGDPDLIDLADAKAHLRLIDVDGEFTEEVQRAIDAAVAFLNVDEDGMGGMGFPLVSETWITRAASFSDEVLRLPFSRVQSVTAVAYTPSSGGAKQVVDPSIYQVTKVGRATVIRLKSGESWPDVATAPDAVEIEFVAGYADTASVPDDIKAAARLLVGHFFENRLAENIGTITSETKIGVDRLTNRYRRFVG